MSGSTWLQLSLTGVWRYQDLIPCYHPQHSTLWLSPTLKWRWASTLGRYENPQQLGLEWCMGITANERGPYNYAVCVTCPYFPLTYTPLVVIFCHAFWNALLWILQDFLLVKCVWISHSIREVGGSTRCHVHTAFCSRITFPMTVLPRRQLIQMPRLLFLMNQSPHCPRW